MRGYQIYDTRTNRDRFADWVRNVDWVTVCGCIFMVGLIVALIWGIGASEANKKVQFMDACAGVGKTEAECKWEWSKSQAQGDDYVPVFIPMSTGR